MIPMLNSVLSKFSGPLAAAVVCAAACAITPAPAALAVPGSLYGDDSAQTASRPKMAPPKPGLVTVMPSADKAPKMLFEKEFHEFGEVDEGDELETAFPFRNDGKGDLIIINNILHCGCSDVVIEVEGKMYVWGEPIAPGAKGIVRFYMKTAGFSNDKPSGADLLTNDPTRGGLGTGAPVAVTGGPQFGVVPLKVHAFIRKLFEFEPANTVTLGSMLNLDDTRRVIYLKNNRGKAFDITAIEPANDPDVKISYEPADATKTRWKMEILVPKGRPNGSITKIFTVKGSVPIPGAMLYVLGTISGAVESEPAGLFAFGPVTKGQATLRQLTIKNRHDTIPLKISNLRLLDPMDQRALKGEAGAKPAEQKVIDNLKFTVSDAVPGKEVKITIECTAGMPVGIFGARLAFETGVEGGPATFVIPISGYVR